MASRTRRGHRGGPHRAPAGGRAGQAGSRDPGSRPSRVYRARVDLARRAKEDVVGGAFRLAARELLEVGAVGGEGEAGRLVQVKGRLTEWWIRGLRHDERAHLGNKADVSIVPPRG